MFAWHECLYGMNVCMALVFALSAPRNCSNCIASKHSTPFLHAALQENKKNQLTENCSVNTDGARSVNKRSKSKVAWTPLQDPHKKSSLLTSAINNKSASTTMLTSMRNRSSSLVDQCQQLEQLIDMQRQSASEWVFLALLGVVVGFAGIEALGEVAVVERAFGIVGVVCVEVFL